MDRMHCCLEVHFGGGRTGPNDSGLSRVHIRATVEQSLASLQTPFIDLLQIHNWDEGTPVREWLRVRGGVTLQPVPQFPCQRLASHRFVDCCLNRALADPQRSHPRGTNSVLRRVQRHRLAASENRVNRRGSGSSRPSERSEPILSVESAGKYQK